MEYSATATRCHIMYSENNNQLEMCIQWRETDLTLDIKRRHYKMGNLTVKVTDTEQLSYILVSMGTRLLDLVLHVDAFNVFSTCYNMCIVIFMYIDQFLMFCICMRYTDCLFKCLSFRILNLLINENLNVLNQ